MNQTVNLFDFFSRNYELWKLENFWTQKNIEKNIRNVLKLEKKITLCVWDFEWLFSNIAQLLLELETRKVFGKPLYFRFSRHEKIDRYWGRGRGEWISLTRKISHLAHNQKGNCHHYHIPFELKRNKNLFLSRDYETTSNAKLEKKLHWLSG